MKITTCALVGNPNCGKTTLFNALTGSNYKVGNWPGVTVEKKVGFCKDNPFIRVIDLPGTYSLNPFSSEEFITYEFLSKEKPDLIINIVDATNLARNLYLTTQLSGLGIPVIIALNMIDEVEKCNGNVDYKQLENVLGITVVPISAYKGTGIDILLKSVFDAKKAHRLFSGLTSEKRYFFASKTANEVLKGMNNKLDTITDKIDGIALNKYLAIPVFLVIIFTVFQVTFGKFGTMLSNNVDYLVNNLFSNFILRIMNNFNISEFVTGMVVDGVLAGVGGVLTFFPQLMLLFLFLAFLEDSGYMSRTAFIMDKFFVKFGLSGKAFIPLLMGFGCSVPAIMASRTLESEKDRKLTILLTPFMSCGAKMPVYSIISMAIFPEHTGIVIFFLYILGIILAVISGIILSKTIFRGDTSPFILEFPPYRMPRIKSLFNHVWDKTKDFFKKAGTVLFISSIIIYLMQHLNFKLQAVQPTDSMIYTFGRILSPVFIPCGYGNTEAAVSLISGFAAKEAIVSTLNIMYGVSTTSELVSRLSYVFSPGSAIAFLVFVLLYVPCITATTTLNKELCSKKLTVFSICYQISIAWIMSFLAYNICQIFI